MIFNDRQSLWNEEYNILFIIYQSIASLLETIKDNEKILGVTLRFNGKMKHKDRHCFMLQQVVEKHNSVNKTQPIRYLAC